MAATATQLAIAKASLTAVLLRPDATHAPWSRADIDEFAGVLALTAARCSPANVQTSKQWMLRHIVHSPARISAVGRYLVALANSFDQAPSTKSDKKETSVRRKRLHLLYIINDVLYHVTFRDKKDGDNSTRPLFVANIEPSLLPLVSSAASFVRAPKQLAKLNDLLYLWGDQHYVADDLFEQLRAAVEEGPRLAEEKQKQKQAKEDKKDKKDQKEASTSSKEARFLLPALHGDPAAPWYDLPAATWLAVLEPNSTRPMNPDALKPIQLAPGPAPPALEASVRALLADVDRMFEGGEAPAIPDVDSDVNALGENIDIDVLTGDTIGGDTYYGWSRAFCQSMKERRRRWKQGISGRPDASPNRDRGRARSRQNDSRSMSMSPPDSSKPAFKRRRISVSPSPGGRDVSRRGRSYSRSRSRSRSHSRDRRREEKSQSRLHVPGHRYHDGKGSSSRSPPRHSPQGNRYRRRSRSRSRSTSNSRSRSRHQYRSRTRSRSRSRSWGGSRSPRRHRYSRSPHKDSYDHNDQPFPTRTPPPHLQHNLPPVPYPQQQQSQLYQQQHPQQQQYGAPPSGYPAFPPPPPPGMPANFPFVPPPPMPPVPPPGYQGQWPPPIPPPQMPPHTGWSGGAPPPPPPPVAPGTSTSGWQGGWGANAPPPPPQQQQPYQQPPYQQYPGYQQPPYDQQRNAPYGQPPQHDQRGGDRSWDNRQQRR